jgi:hypothetical protein
VFSLRPVHLDEENRIRGDDFSWVCHCYGIRGGSAPASLPSCGVIAEDDIGKRIAAAFMYLDACGSGTAMLAWCCTDPDIIPTAADFALSTCFHHLQEHARELGYSTVIAYYNTRSLTNLLTRDGFTVCEENVTSLIKPL